MSILGYLTLFISFLIIRDWLSSHCPRSKPWPSCFLLSWRRRLQKWTNSQECFLGGHLSSWMSLISSGIGWDQEELQINLSQIELDQRILHRKQIHHQKVMRQAVPNLIRSSSFGGVLFLRGQHSRNRFPCSWPFLGWWTGGECKFWRMARSRVIWLTLIGWHQLQPGLLSLIEGPWWLRFRLSRSICFSRARFSPRLLVFSEVPSTRQVEIW